MLVLWHSFDLCYLTLVVEDLVLLDQNANNQQGDHNREAIYKNIDDILVRAITHTFQERLHAYSQCHIHVLKCVILWSKRMMFSHSLCDVFGAAMSILCAKLLLALVNISAFP